LPAYGKQWPVGIEQLSRYQGPELGGVPIEVGHCASLVHFWTQKLACKYEVHT